MCTGRSPNSDRGIPDGATFFDRGFGIPDTLVVRGSDRELSGGSVDDSLAPTRAWLCDGCDVVHQTADGIGTPNPSPRNLVN